MNGLSGFDAWLTTDRAAEEADRLAEAWETHCDEEDVDPEDEEAYQDWLSSLHDRDEDPHNPCDDGHPDML